jgi:hypothetical protein
MLSLKSEKDPQIDPEHPIWVLQSTAKGSQSPSMSIDTCKCLFSLTLGVVIVRRAKACGSTASGQVARGLSYDL